MGHHSAAGLAAGLTKEEIRAILDYATEDRFSQRERLVLQYAEAMTLAPARVDDALFDRLRREFDEAEIVELTLVIATYNLTNRFNLALGVDLEPIFERLLAEIETPGDERQQK